MTFKKVSGLPGKVYQPVKPTGAENKHDCGDCFACQQCSDDRCGLCRDAGSEPSQPDTDAGECK